MYKLTSTNSIKTTIIIVSIGLWCINFFYVHKDKPLEFRIAKGFGLNLRCWPIFLYATMLRTLLHGRVEKHVVYHKFIGYVMLICTIGHGVAHMFYDRTPDLVHITGYILFGFFLLMAIGYASRSLNYSFFKYTHYLYYVILPLMIVHVTRFWVWFGVPLIVIAIEIFLNLNKLQYSSIKNFDKQGDHMFISLPRCIDSVPGSYYYLCVPSLSKYNFFGIPLFGYLEWHPFSLCSSSHINHLTFMIECKGDWTSAFYRKITDRTTVLVMGPFRTSSSLIMNNDIDQKTIVCTGIGITPFISVIQSKIDEYYTNDKYRNDYSEIFERDIEQQRAYSLISSSTKDRSLVTYKTASIDIYWTFRDLKKVINFFNYVRKILSRSKNINLHIYITAKMDEQEQKEFIEKYQSHGVKTINFKRMDNNVLKETKQVFFCGSPVVRTSMKEICQKHNIEFYSEVF